MAEQHAAQKGKHRVDKVDGGGHAGGNKIIGAGQQQRCAGKAQCEHHHPAHLPAAQSDRNALMPQKTPQKGGNEGVADCRRADGVAAAGIDRFGNDGDTAENDG